MEASRPSRISLVLLLPCLCGAGALAREPAGRQVDACTLAESPIVHPSQTDDIGRITVAFGARSPATQPVSVSSKRLSKYEYRRRLPHLQKADAQLFITFCTNGRSVLLDHARTLVLQHCLREKRIQLLAAVVMPDHVHLAMTPLRDDSGWPFALVDILQCLKSTTAHRINRLLHSSGPVWEEESFDHVLRSDESMKAKCEYIRQNPVRAGLVGRAKDYRWLWVNPKFDSED